MADPLSPNAFQLKLTEDLEVIARSEGLNLSTSENAGFAFARYVASLFMQHDFGLHENIEDVVLRGGNDLGIDVVMQDDANRTVVLVQAKYQGHGKSAKPLDVDAARAFLGRHDGLCDTDHVSRGSELAKELLSSYRERVTNGWKARFYFVSTGTASPGIEGEFQARNSLLDASPCDVEFVLIDRAGLRDMYNGIAALEESIPEQIEIDIPANTFFEKKGPLPCIVGVLKGNSLRNEYQKKGRRESLFAWNIRNYLGDRGINKAIKATATDHAPDFFYFNNGITAVCTNYELRNNKLLISKFQIINGAQTVASIAKAPPHEQVEVLFRLIKTGRVDTESGINREIIRCNNTQNAIKLSDFRSNDPIQRWLKQEIGAFRVTETIGKVTYQPKRTAKRGHGRTIQLEEFGKIRYAYLRDPILVFGSPKDLWTPASDDEGGSYEVAFGLDGLLPAEWPKSALEEALLAVAFHDEAERAARLERARDPECAFFLRLRFHALALAGYYMRAAQPHSAKSLLGERQKFDEVWQIIWGEARRALFSVHRQYTREQNMTMFAFVRSEQAWNAILTEFKFGLRL